MKSLRTIAVVVLSSASASPALAQQAPRPVPAPDAVFDEPFSAVTVGSVRELRDGRLIVSDGRDKVVHLIDLKTQGSTPIGREGSGPGEFGLPSRVYAATGDTTYLFDPLNQRYMLIGPDGKPGAQFRIEMPQTQGPGGGMMMGMAMARHSDARGRLYFEGMSVRMGPNGPEPVDSVPILRYDRATQALDTLAVVKLQKNSTQVSGGQGNMRMMVGGGNPLAPRDEWAVFPDGRVAIVRAEPYRVDWVMPDGSKRSAAAIPHRPIRITDADRREEEALRAAARQNTMMVTVNQGPGGVQRSAQMGGGANMPPLPPITDWPEVKPPFRAGQASVLARPNGELWVRRLEPAGAKGALYDVIDAKGAVTYQVRLQDGWTLVGFGNGTMYTTKRDEDDLVYLQRHRIPDTPLRG